MPSISILCSSSSTITILSEGLSSSINYSVPSSKLVDLKKVKKNKKNNFKIHTQVFRHCCIQQMHKISEKNSKPSFSWSYWKFSFLKEKTWLLVNNKSLSKVTQQYFSVQKQYNQTKTNFVIKSNET